MQVIDLVPDLKFNFRGRQWPVTKLRFYKFCHSHLSLGRRRARAIAHGIQMSLRLDLGLGRL